MNTHDYVYVRDLDSGAIVASYFVVRPGEAPDDYPRDTSHGGIPTTGKADFIEILTRTWPQPRYRVESGFASSLEAMADQWEALVDHERPTFDGEREYLCVWNRTTKRMLECTLVGDGPNPEDLPTVGVADKNRVFAALQARHEGSGLMVVEVTTTSYADAVRCLGG